MCQISRRLTVILALVGLAIRLVGAFLYGTQDMEWWKAWGSYAARVSLTDIYGARDAEIIQLWNEGRTLNDIRSITQRIIPYDSHDYFRKEFKLGQPPLYIYSLYLSTQLYRMISNDLSNNRLFNFFLNLQPILFSGMLAVVIAVFVSSVASPAVGWVAGLVYWLNPLVVLNSPIQAYQDPMCVLFATISVVMVFRKKLIYSCIFLVLSFLSKPQGVLIAPVVLWVGLCDYPIVRNVKAWFAGIVTGLLVGLPYIVSGRFIGMIIGVLSITESSTDLSRQSMNIWWPIQYAANAIHLYRWEGVQRVPAILGADQRLFSDYPIAKFAEFTAVNPSLIGLTFLGAFTLVNLSYVAKNLERNRLSIVIAAGLQVYGYFILRTGVQINHYFLLIPIFSLIACVKPGWSRHFFLIGIVFLIQDLLFYGLGRDCNPGRTILARLSLGWITVLLSFINVGLFFYLCAHYYFGLRIRTRIGC